MNVRTTLKETHKKLHLLFISFFKKAADKQKYKENKSKCGESELSLQRAPTCALLPPAGIRHLNVVPSLLALTYY